MAATIRQHVHSTVPTSATFGMAALAGSVILLRDAWRPQSDPGGGGAGAIVYTGFTELAAAAARGESIGGVGIFGKDAAGGETIFNQGAGSTASAHIVCAIEITGSALSAVEVVSASRQTTANPHDLSAHAAAYGIGLDVFIAVQTSGSTNRTWSGGAGNADWTEDYDAGCGSAWFGDLAPWIWMGDAAPNAGAGLTPTISLTPPSGNSLAEWAGVSVLVRDAAPSDPLVCSFSLDPATGAIPLSVDFTDSTTGVPDGWDWDFGDGTSHGTTQNPTHVYTVAGSYDVTLTASRSGDMDECDVTVVDAVNAVATVAGVFGDWDGDGFDPNTSDNLSTNVIRWVISRGSGAEVTGGSQPGSATLTLKNPSDIYNPRNASSPLYPTVADGVPIWIGPNSDGKLTGSDARGLFAGKITDVTLIPSPGTSKPATVEFQCEDALGWYQRTPVSLDYVEGRSHKVLRQAALDAVGETRYTLDTESATMPLSHADGDLLSVLDQINAINGTRHLAKPNDSYIAWYDYTTRNRMYGLFGVADESVSASSDHVTETDGWRLSADTVTNRQKATITPIQFTPGSFTVWQADVLPFDVTETSPYTRIVDFDDVVSGSLLDIAYTGDTITQTYTPFASGAKIELTVAPGDSATVSALSVEGRLARRLEQQSAQADDTVSQALPRGIRAGSDIGNEYLGVIASAKGIAEHVVWRYGNPQLRPTLTIVNWLPEQFDLDLYDVISLTSTHLGMSAVLFEIVGLTHTGEWASDGGVLHTVQYVLQESRVQTATDWFTWDVSDWDDAGSPWAYL